MANVKITTGQYVMIEQRVASVSDRVFAQMLDMLFLMVYEGIISLFVFSFIFSARLPLRTENIVLIFYIALQLPVIFYHPVCEYFFGGASPGKKILKIKVVQIDGASPTLGSYLMRWIMYLLECLMFAGIGLLCIIFNKHGQRLGDMMAGTVVIKSDTYHNHHINLGDFGYVKNGYKPCYHEVASLSMRQAQVVSETLLLRNSNRYFYINRLSDKIREVLNIPPLLDGDNEMFLNTILNDYRFFSSTVEI